MDKTVNQLCKDNAETLIITFERRAMVKWPDDPEQAAAFRELVRSVITGSNVSLAGLVEAATTAAIMAQAGPPEPSAAPLIAHRAPNDLQDRLEADDGPVDEQSPKPALDPAENKPLPLFPTGPRLATVRGRPV